MKKTVRLVSLAVLCVAIFSGLLLPTGCEIADGLQGLTVQPSSVTLTPSSNEVTFVVTVSSSNTLAYPIEWTLSEPSLGYIVGSSGNFAVYRRSASNGRNFVTARDQYGNEGFATVSQTVESYALELTVSPSGGISVPGACTITVDGGFGPYDWWVRDSGSGRIVGPRDGATVAYESRAGGSNIVYVRDANGVIGMAVIEQFE